MGGQAKTRRTNTLTTTRARLDFQTTATDDRVCPDQQRRTASACSICASLPSSLPTKAVHTRSSKGHQLHPYHPPSTPLAFPPSPYDSRKHPPRPLNPQRPPPTAMSRAACLFFSSTPTVLASAPRCDRSLRRASGGSLGTYLTVPLSRSIGRTPRSCSCGTRARSCIYTHKRRFD